MQQDPAAKPSGLRRDLGTIESYAAMVGMMIGAGIFRVTGLASEQTGPSVILGYLVLAPYWDVNAFMALLLSLLFPITASYQRLGIERQIWCALAFDVPKDVDGVDDH